MIKQRARFGQIFWCEFPVDAPSAEFHAEHPVVVIRSAPDLKGACIVVPITTKAAPPSPTVHKLRRNYNPAAPKLEVWAIGNHIYTVSQERLRPFVHRGQQVVPKMHADDLADVMAAIRAALPQVFPEPAPQPATIDLPKAEPKE
jgi:mRNA interferase MazF